MNNNVHFSTLTCPNPICRHQQQALMPTTFCQLAYTCEACSMIHVHKSGDCCVFCSYADKPCPSMQEGEICCSPGFSDQETAAPQGCGKEWKPMNQSFLNILATRLAAHLDCTQDVACRQIMQAMAETGQPLAPIHLAMRLRMSQESLTAHLAGIPDTEFDEQGNIVGWGVTLLPTQHQFRLKELPLFTWCAFDTVLFPPLLQVEAHVRSSCEATGQPITFVATRSAGIADLLPATSVLSLILPAERCDCVRGTFCEQSLFFQSEEAASSWMALHPDAVLLSVEEAAILGQMVANLWPHEYAA